MAAGKLGVPPFRANGGTSSGFRVVDSRDARVATCATADDAAAVAKALTSREDLFAACELVSDAFSLDDMSMFTTQQLRAIAYARAAVGGGK